MLLSLAGCVQQTSPQVRTFPVITTQTSDTPVGFQCGESDAPRITAPMLPMRNYLPLVSGTQPLLFLLCISN